MERKSRKSSSSERELERRKMRQELFSNAMNDLTALRDHYKAELREKLEMKVAQQRKEREEQKALDKTALEKAMIQQKSSHRFAVKLPKSSATDDKEYLQDVAFSKFYVINEIRNHLEKNNELDKKYKVDEFNEIIHSPQVLEIVEIEREKGNNMTLGKLKQIIRNQEDENLSSVAGEVVEDSVRSDEKVRQDKIKKERTKHKRSTGSLDVIFPTVQYPELKIVNRCLDNPESNLEKESISRGKKKRQEIEERKRMLERMHRASQSYEAATNRLLEKFGKRQFHEISGIYDTENIVASRRGSNPDCDLRDHGTPAQAIPAGGVAFDTEMNTNIHRYLDSLNDLIISDESSGPSHYEGAAELKPKSTKPKQILASDRATPLKKWEGRVYSDEVLRKEIMGIRDVQREPQILAPLTMEALEETTIVKVIKDRDIWVNPEH